MAERERETSEALDQRLHDSMDRLGATALEWRRKAECYEAALREIEVCASDEPTRRKARSALAKAEPQTLSPHAPSEVSNNE